MIGEVKAMIARRTRFHATMLLDTLPMYRRSSSPPNPCSNLPALRSRPKLLLTTCASIILWVSIAQGQEHGSANQTVRAIIETSEGNIHISLFAEKAPITVKNFLHYVDSGCYKDSQFFRTVRLDNQPDSKIKIEVIQASANRDHRKRFQKPIPLERTNKTGLTHEDGALSMARSKPDSGTHHFFICIGDQPSLDFGGKRNPDGQGFAVFGKVTKGMDIVKKIQAGKDTKQQLKEPVKIKNIRRLKS